MTRTWQKIRIWLPGVLLLTALLGGSCAWFAPVRLYLFAVPAGGLLAVLTGGEFLLRAGEAAVVETAGLRVIIPPSCSGFTFFLMVLAVAWRGLPPGRWWRLPLALGAGYVYAVAVNTVRILLVSRWEWLVAGRLPLPAEFQHLTVGILIFLPALILFYTVIRKGLNDDCRSAV